MNNVLDSDEVCIWRSVPSNGQNHIIGVLFDYVFVVLGLSCVLMMRCEIADIILY